MSHATIYQVTKQGDVRKFGEVKNATAGALHVWGALAREHRIDCPGMRYEPLWKKFSDPLFPVHDRIILGFTFDRVWVRRENIHKLVSALGIFWRRHSKMQRQPWDVPGEPYDVNPTIPGIGEVLLKLHEEQPDARGACFDQTSVARDVWWLRSPEEEDGHAFNFDSGELLCRGTPSEGRPWELFEGLEKPSITDP